MTGSSSSVALSDFPRVRHGLFHQLASPLSQLNNLLEVLPFILQRSTLVILSCTRWPPSTYLRLVTWPKTPRIKSGTKDEARASPPYSPGPTGNNIHEPYSREHEQWAEPTGQANQPSPERANKSIRQGGERVEGEVLAMTSVPRRQSAVRLLSCQTLPYSRAYTRKGRHFHTWSSNPRNSNSKHHTKTKPIISFHFEGCVPLQALLLRRTRVFIYLLSSFYNRIWICIRGRAQQMLPLQLAYPWW